MSSGIKRPLLDDDGIGRNGKAIKIKAEASPTGEDYSNDVKRKLESSSRTGQACDRCRMRKMRCDGGIEGCAPCLQNHSPCRTTDRMTGVANERGYVRKLELRIQTLHSELNRLTSQLKALRQDVKPVLSDGFEKEIAYPKQDRSQESIQVQYMPPGRRRIDDDDSTTGDDVLPGFREGLSGDNYLGVSSGNSFISSIRGTSLNVLGMEIDLADNLSPDLEEPKPLNDLAQLSPNKSYHAFIQTAFGTGPKPHDPGLPSRQDAFLYAGWCFKTVLSYLPILHKPTFFALLSRVYDDPAFTPSSAETVQVHIVLALMYFQVASRNYENAQQRRELHHRSNRHYHYAVKFFPDLVAGRTLEDVQALAMISAQLRSFAKPGACWMVTGLALNIAIELGLHRSAKCWASTAPNKSALEIEMRKRVFWSIFLIHIYVSGKLGRPMALSESDIDVELPEAVDDEAISEDGIDTSQTDRCGFRIGLEAFKSNLIFLDMYNNLYTVRRSASTYLDDVRRLERRIDLWRQQWPEELKLGSSSNIEQYRVEARYMAIWELELRLLLRHPSLELTSSSTVNEENLSICMDLSKRMLEHVRWLERHKSLDTNWQTNVTYVLALSTTLYGHWVRKETISIDDIRILRDDMDGWLRVMGEIGSLIGSGKRLQESVQVVVGHTIENLIQHMASKSSMQVSPAHPTSMCATPTGPAITTTAQQYSRPHIYPLPPQSTNYISTDQYAFPNTPISNSASTAPILPLGTFSVDGPGQPSLHAKDSTANAYSYANANEPTQPTAIYQPATLDGQMAQASASWRDFTGNVITNLEPRDFMTPASALLQLRNRQIPGAASIVSPNVFPNENRMPTTTLDGASSQQWPILLFEGQPAVQ